MKVFNIFLHHTDAESWGFVFKISDIFQRISHQFKMLLFHNVWCQFLQLVNYIGSKHWPGNSICIRVIDLVSNLTQDKGILKASASRAMTAQKQTTSERNAYLLIYIVWNLWSSRIFSALSPHQLCNSEHQDQLESATWKEAFHAIILKNWGDITGALVNLYNNGIHKKNH